MSIADTLRPELATSLKALFKKLDRQQEGSICVKELKQHWSQGEGRNERLSQQDVIDSIERFGVNGRLSYERLCCGIKFSLIDSADDTLVFPQNEVNEPPPVTPQAKAVTASGHQSYNRIISVETNDDDYRLSKELFPIKSHHSSNESNDQDEFQTPLMTSTRIFTNSEFKRHQTPASTSSRRETTVPKLSDSEYQSKFITSNGISGSSQKYDVSDKQTKEFKIDFSKLGSNSLSDFNCLPESNGSGIRESRINGSSNSPKVVERQNGGMDTEKNGTNFSLMSSATNDQSFLLTQSFIKNFGYHPPREFSPFNIELPAYEMPTTLLDSHNALDAQSSVAKSDITKVHQIADKVLSSSTHDVEHVPHNATDSHSQSNNFYTYENLKFTSNSHVSISRPSPTSSDTVISRSRNLSEQSHRLVQSSESNTDPVSSHGDRSNAFGSSLKYTQLKSGDSVESNRPPRRSVFSPELTENGSTCNSKFDPLALTKSEEKLLQNRRTASGTPEGSDTKLSEHRSSVSDRPESATSSTPARYEAYFELDSPEYQVKYTKNNNASHNGIAQFSSSGDSNDAPTSNNRDLTKSGKLSGFTTNKDLIDRANFDYREFATNRDTTYTKETSSLNGESHKLFDQLPSRTDDALSGRLSSASTRCSGDEVESSITDLEKSLNKSRKKLSHIISVTSHDTVTEQNGVSDGHSRSAYTTSGGSSGVILHPPMSPVLSSPPKSILKNSKSHETPLSLDDQDKLDKMFDQALTAVNESYRLIRIGKKSLRSKGTVRESEGGEFHQSKYLSLLRHVLDLHRSLLELIDEDEADLAEEMSCSQCGVCTTCQYNLQTIQLSLDKLHVSCNASLSGSDHRSSISRTTSTYKTIPLSSPTL